MRIYVFILPLALSHAYAISSKTIIKDIAAGLAAYATFFIAHNAGHYCAAQFLLKQGCQTVPGKDICTIENLHFGYKPFKMVLPIFSSESHNRIVDLCGTFFSIVAFYGIYKIANIANELGKHTTLYESVKAGMNKNLINDQQPIGIHLA